MVGLRDQSTLHPAPARPLATDLGVLLAATGPAEEIRELAEEARRRGLVTVLQEPRLLVAMRGDRLHRAEVGGRSCVMVGCTAEARPAERLLRDGEVAEECRLHADPFLINGHFAGVIASRRGASLFTDHVGSVPWFETTTGPFTVWSTDLRLLVELAGKDRLDPASVREYLLRGAVTWPGTIIQGVRRAAPASIASIDAAAAELPRVRHYWEPRRRSADPDLREVAERARTIMESNVHGALDQVGSAVLFYSGGEDARVLGAICRRHRGAGRRVRGVIFLDRINREHLLARTSAWLLGMPLEVRLRDPDHYFAGMSEGLRLTGGGVDLAHNHAVGLVEPSEAELFIDGWTADSYLKAWALQDLLEVRAGRAPAPPPDHALDAEIESRRLARLETLRSLRGLEDDANCWLGLWPISDHVDYGNLGVNIRARPSISPYMFGNFVDSVVEVSESRKLDRALFRSIFGCSMGASGWIPRSGGEIPAAPAAIAPWCTAAVKRIFRVEDRVRSWLGRSRAQGPWQNAAIRLAAATRARSATSADAIATIASVGGLEDMLRRPDQILRLIELATLVRDGLARP